MTGTNDIDLSADVGSTFALGPDTTVTIIDPFERYLESLKSCFDFEKLQAFVKRDGFSMLFDGMHGAGGPFAQRILVEELGLPQVSLKVGQGLLSMTINTIYDDTSDIDGFVIYCLFIAHV